MTKHCPKCNQESKVNKKGYNAKGQQRWLCKNCGKTFVEPDSPVVRPPKGKKTTTSSKKPAKKVATKKATKLAVKPKKVTKKSDDFKTTIKVNSNEIKTIDGDISEDEAFSLVSNYFREITRTNVKVKKEGNKKIITFTVRVGTKGCYH